MTPSPELLEGCIKNNRKSQQQLYKLCFGFILRVCMRYTNNRDNANAMLNTAFLKILNNLQTFNQQTQFEPWIRTIVIRTAIDDFRKNKQYDELIEHVENLAEVVPAHYSSMNEAAEKLDAAYIDLCLLALPAMSRQVFNLFAIDGYSHKEISSMLNIAEGTTKWHVSFARQKLKELIIKQLSPTSITNYENSRPI